MVEVVDVQELLEVAERCLEGTEDVTNPSDVGHAADDVHHSFDGAVDMHLVHDVLLNFDVVFLQEDDLDGLLVLDVDDDLQPLILDDRLDLSGQHDVLLDVHLVHDVLLNSDVDLSLDDFLDDFLC